MEGELDETLGPLGVPFWGVLSRLEEIGGDSGGDGGGSAEEMDLDGAGTADDGGGEPCWAEMTRRSFGRGCALAARRRRQAFARPLAGPPKTLPVLSAPGWILMFLLKLAHSSQHSQTKVTATRTSEAGVGVGAPWCQRGPDDKTQNSLGLFVRSNISSQ